jgi:RNA polymerase sigma-70 factor (ECF subfamily)
MKFVNGSKSCESHMPTCPSGHPEAGWVLAAANGDLDAFNLLVLSYQDLVYSRAFMLLGDRYSAEDATQESFIKVFQNIGGFHGGPFRAWLLKIVVNTCYDEIRKSKRHPAIPLLPENEDEVECESPAWLADPNASVQAIVERKEFSRALAALLAELPDIYRYPLALVDAHGYDYSQAATVLAIPIGTIKSRLSRARLQMKQKLQSQFDFSKKNYSIDAGFAGWRALPYIV